MSHTVQWEPGSLYRKFSAEISGEEILKSNFDIQMHPNFAKIKYLINDFNDVTDVHVDPAHAKIFASTDDIISDTKGRLKIAIVTNNPAHIELARLYRSSMKNRFFECEIFASIDEAKEWAESK